MEGIRRNNPDALRAAVLIENTLGTRGRWTASQGVDYAAFRRALVANGRSKWSERHLREMTHGPSTVDAAACPVAAAMAEGGWIGDGDGRPRTFPSVTDAGSSTWRDTSRSLIGEASSEKRFANGSAFEGGDVMIDDGGREGPLIARHRRTASASSDASTLSASTTIGGAGGCSASRGLLVPKRMKMVPAANDGNGGLAFGVTPTAIGGGRPAAAVRVVRWSKLGARTMAVGREDGTVELIACAHGHGEGEADEARGDEGRAGRSEKGHLRTTSSASTGKFGRFVPWRFRRLATLRGHSRAITDADWTLAGGDLATSSLDGDVRLWSAADAADGGWRCARKISVAGCSHGGFDPSKGGAVNAVRFHPSNGNLLVLGLESKAVWLVNASTGRRVATVSSRMYMAAPITSLALNGSGSLVYAGDAAGKIHVIACDQRRTAVTSVETKGSNDVASAKPRPVSARHVAPRGGKSPSEGEVVAAASDGIVYGAESGRISIEELLAMSGGGFVEGNQDEEEEEEEGADDVAEDAEDADEGDDGDRDEVGEREEVEDTESTVEESTAVTGAGTSGSSSDATFVEHRSVDTDHAASSSASVPPPLERFNLVAAIRANASQLPALLPSTLTLTRAVRHHLTLISRAKPPTSTAASSTASSDTPLRHKGGGGVRGITHVAQLGLAGGPALLVVFRCGLVRVFRASDDRTSPAARPVVGAQLPMWPRLAGAAAFAPTLHPKEVPHAAATTAGGGGAALYAMPSKDGAPVMRVMGLTPPGPPGRGALEEPATAAEWCSGGDLLALGYGSGGVFVWARLDDGDD